MKNKKSLVPNYWYSKNNEVVSCKEKIKVLNSNIDDLKNMVEEIYDEALLMDVDPKQVKEVFHNLLNNIETALKSEK